MKICFLAPANNYHTKKWCEYFTQFNHEVHVISFINDKIKNVTVHYIDCGIDVSQRDISKIKYLMQARKVRKIVNTIKPDIINAHYATSYGTVAALAGLKKYILSVWGSDIYEFPMKSIFHKAMLKYSLRSAKYIFSTSKAMAEEAKKYTNKRIEITPFGVKMDLFTPDKRVRLPNDEMFVIGTVKTLAPKYGIEYLLKAVALVRNNHPEIPIQLRIAGRGSHEVEYKQLALDLGISDVTIWLGFISQEEVAKEWANMDVAVVVSESESFGVSAVEAQACGVPVIITEIPGLMEATNPGVTSVVVPRNDENTVAEAIVQMYFDSELRKKMGVAGRQYVTENYDYHECFKRIEDLYSQIIAKEAKYE